MTSGASAILYLHIGGRRRAQQLERRKEKPMVAVGLFILLARQSFASVRVSLFFFLLRFITPEQEVCIGRVDRTRHGRDYLQIQIKKKNKRKESK